MARLKNHKVHIEKAQDKVEKARERFLAKFEKLIESKKRPTDDQNEAATEQYNDVIDKINALHDAKDEAAVAEER